MIYSRVIYNNSYYHFLRNVRIVRQKLFCILGKNSNRYIRKRVGIGKEFHYLSLSKAHDPYISILLDCAFLHIHTYNDSAEIEITIKCLGFTQKLRTENQVGVAMTKKSAYQI